MMSLKQLLSSISTRHNIIFKLLNTCNKKSFYFKQPETVESNSMTRQLKIQFLQVILSLNLKIIINASNKETKCYIQTTASYPKRIKGTCTLKLSYLMFENEDLYKTPLIINIFDILELSQSYNWRVNEPCIMKIVTQNEKFNFYGWQESLQQFLKAYVTKEVIFENFQKLCDQLNQIQFSLSFET